MRHPDRGSFELDYFLNTSGNTRFTINNASETVVKDTTFSAMAGENSFKFKNTTTILNGKQYKVTLTTSENKNYTIIIRLH